ncbi:MAG: SGNH/GDSL hydrolase family protein [Planctomycetota bacterium]
MAKTRRRLALATTSTLVSAAIAVPLVRQYVASAGENNVVFVDTNDELTQILQRDKAAPEETHGAPEGPELVLRPLDEETAKQFFPSLELVTVDYDEHAYVLNVKSHSRMKKWEEHPDGEIDIQTNSEGFRETEEVRTEGVDFRVAVLGDSHTAGVIATDESFANVLEARLGQELSPKVVDVINAGVGGTTVYNYLGMIELLAKYEPDAYVVTVYGGNDFGAAAKLRRYFERLGPYRVRGAIKPAAARKAWRESGKTRAQETQQVRYFDANPEDVDLAIGAVQGVLGRMADRCEELDAELIVVYLPPPLSAQPEQYAEYIEMATLALGDDTHGLTVSDMIADPMLSFAEERGLTTVDLRIPFGQTDEPLYWFADFHIDIEGHQAVADELFPILFEIAQ